MTDETVVILLVEDDPGDQELTRRAMNRRMPEIDLRIVADGEEALEYLLREGRYADSVVAPRPDLVLLDLNMPKIDGRAVLQRIRREPDLADLPVTMLTTSHRDADVVRSYEMGCDSYFTKPVEMEDFMQLVSLLVAGARPTPSDAFDEPVDPDSL